MYQCDRQMERQTDTSRQQRPFLRIASRDNNKHMNFQERNELLTAHLTELMLTWHNSMTAESCWPSSPAAVSPWINCCALPATTITIPCLTPPCLLTSCSSPFNGCNIPPVRRVFKQFWLDVIHNTTDDSYLRISQQESNLGCMGPST